MFLCLKHTVINFISIYEQQTENEIFVVVCLFSFFCLFAAQLLIKSPGPNAIYGS